MTEPTRQTPLAIEQLQREIDALRAAPGPAKVQHAERVGALALELLADHCRRLDELERTEVPNADALDKAFLRIRERLRKLERARSKGAA